MPKPCLCLLAVHCHQKTCNRYVCPTSTSKPNHVLLFPNNFYTEVQWKCKELRLRGEVEKDKDNEKRARCDLNQ